MILLVDDKKDWRMSELRDSLRIGGIPCVIVHHNDIQEFPQALVVFAFTPSENHLNTVSLRCKRIPLLAVNESGSRIYNNDVLFYDSKSYSTYESFILGFIKEKYGIVAGEYIIDDVKLNGTDAVCGISKFSLTPAENRILSLLAVCRKQWLSEKIIGRVCFDDPSKSCRVPVHICNINKKARTIIGHKLIQAKRGMGYTVE